MYMHRQGQHGIGTVLILVSMATGMYMRTVKLIFKQIDPLMK